VVQGTKKRFNPELKVEGILFTMDVSRFNNAKRNKEAVKAAYGEEIRIFETAIPRSESIAETASEGISIFAYDIRSKGAKSYGLLVQEVLNYA
jgi:chromosome partitioning protein